MHEVEGLKDVTVSWHVP